MEDVIFAGTAGRPALGRAEVTLTIDNADGALPIEYTEVSITRRMYRSGESEYEINGDKVRLLDVQELLSDSGIGREMHVIVGQGQLDAVLSGHPEDRRAFIEEAAGVLKHRKRKEKALRKLDAMQANLDRLADLTAELRRQLKPLGRQADRKSTRLNSSHANISYAVFCLKKKKDNLHSLTNTQPSLQTHHTSYFNNTHPLTEYSSNTSPRTYTLHNLTRRTIIIHILTLPV